MEHYMILKRNSPQHRCQKLLSFLVLLSFLAFPHAGLAQTAVQGGLQGSETVILTPDGALNKQIQGRNIDEVPELGASQEDGRLVLLPHQPRDWQWVAGFNVRWGEKRFNFFMVDGKTFTSEQFKTNVFLTRYKEDVTGRISSNAFHIALHRTRVVENELAIFVVSPKKQRVVIEIPPDLVKRKRILEYHMEENESKFIHIDVLPEEFTSVTWAPEKVSRRVVPLSDDWRFKKGEIRGAEKENFNGSSWDRVSLPHTWNARDVYDTRNIRDDLDVFELYDRGPSWYRKSFSLEPSVRGQRLFLQFLGANQVADAWLNGKYLGQHRGGYTGFEFDITDVARIGRENLLAVRVDNSFNYDIPPHTADFDFFGGLYRQVQLLVTHPIHVKDVNVTTPNVSSESATVRVVTTLANQTSTPRRVRFVTNIVNPYGEIVRSMVDEKDLPASGSLPVEQLSDSITNPLLWSPKYPWLYKVYSTLYNDKGEALDQTVSPLGFRWYSFSADQGFSMNGERLKIKGVNYHQDYLNKGNAVPLAQKREDILHIKRMGANFVRLAHYPHHPYVLDLCDSVGLLVWQEIPVVNSVGGKKFGDNAKQMLREMIGRDKNHPSIILWGLGNEFSRDFQPKETLGDQKVLLGELNALAKQLDPSRLTTQAQNHYTDSSVMAITDVQGRNRYYGWYEGTYDDFGRVLDEERKQFPTWKFLVSEYGAEAKYGYHVDNPRIFDHSETYQLDFHRVTWKAIEERPWIAGAAIWTMFDFSSFVKIGNIPRINQKGMMTADRKPKDVYYFYQSQWSDEPMVYIVSHTWTHRTATRGLPQTVRLFSNCSSVELFLNGKSLGGKIGGYEWSVPFAEGNNSLKAVGQKDGQTVADEMAVYVRFPGAKDGTPDKKEEGN